MPVADEPLPVAPPLPPPAPPCPAAAPAIASDPAAINVPTILRKFILCASLVAEAAPPTGTVQIGAHAFPDA
jgi:hypothetical protein